MRRFILPVLLFAASPAAFGMDPSLRGFYIGGGIGEATVDFKDDRTRDHFDADDTGFKLIAGYRIIDWVAVEVNYTDYGKPVDRAFGVDLQAEYSALSVSALGLLPLGKFDLFGRLGVARVDGDFSARGFTGRDSNESTDPYVGFGAQFRPNPNLAIRVEADGVLIDASNRDSWDWWDDDWDDDDDSGDWLTLLSLSVTYKF